MTDKIWEEVLKERKQEMDLAYKEMKKGWGDVLKDLWTSFGKPVDQQRMIIYARQLKTVPLDLLEKAVSLAIRRQSYNTPPTVHEVFSALETILEGPYDLDQAIAEWVDRSAQRCIIPFG